MCIHWHQPFNPRIHIRMNFYEFVAPRNPKAHFSTTKSITLLFLSGFLLHISALNHSCAILISSGGKLKRQWWVNTSTFSIDGYVVGQYISQTRQIFRGILQRVITESEQGGYLFSQYEEIVLLLHDMFNYLNLFIYSLFLNVQNIPCTGYFSLCRYLEFVHFCSARTCCTELREMTTTSQRCITW